MTGLFAIFFAVAAGWFARPGRQVVLAVTVPYVAVCTVQSAGLALGYGVNPPDTVADVSYWLVQGLILAITLGAADQISRVRSRQVTSSGDGGRRALAVNGLLAAVLVGLFYAFRPVLDPGSVAHHTGTGGPPWAALAGIGLCLLVLVVLGLASLVRRQLHTVGR